MGVNEYIQIGSRIKEERLRTTPRISQKEMASLLGIPVSTYSGYENNSREPSLPIITKVAEILNIPITNLIYKSVNDIPAMYPDIEKTCYAVLDALSQNPNIGLMDIVDLVISRTTSAPEPAAMKLYSSLNEAGKQKAEEYLSDLAQMPKYQQNPGTKK